MNLLFVFSLATLAVFGYVMILFLRSSRSSRPVKITLILSAIVMGPALAIWTIAGSDRLFRQTVPIEQRLVSYNESIRTKAQQELLGYSADTKRDIAGRLIPALTQDDRSVRKWAAISLALIGPGARDAIPALLQGVSARETDVAQACRVALSEIGAPDPEQLPALMQSLQDAREAVRCEAASSIAKIGPAAKEAIPLLLNDVHNSEDLPVCTGEALATLVTGSPEEIPSVLVMLSNSSPAIRRNGAYVLSLIGPRTSEIVEALLKTVAADADGSVRQMAAKALLLKQAPDRGELATLTYAMQKAKSDVVREGALNLLRRSPMAFEQVLPFLRDALHDPSAAIRYDAINWLADAGAKSKPAVPALLDALRDPDAKVRRAVLEALGRIGTRRSDALPLLGHQQKDPDPEVRCLAAERLVEMGGADRVAVSLLVNDLREQGDTSRCAVEALGMTGHFNSEVVPAMIKILQEKDPALRGRAVLVLMQLGSKARAAIPALAQAQKDQIAGAENALKAIRDALPRPSHGHVGTPAHAR